MSDMIETVAKAIGIESDGTWDSLTASRQRFHRDVARAAIEAMRASVERPTELVELDSDEEWDLELRAFAGVNSRSWPKAAQDLISDLWRQYCFAAAYAHALSQSPSLPTPAATPTDSANPPPVESVGPNSTGDA